MSDDKLRILIADENRDAAAALAALLRSWGHEANTAGSGARALEQLEVFRPRVLIVDLALPDMHGYDLVRQARTAAGSRKMYFIAITGWAQIADQIKGTAIGVTHHLLKPANTNVLKEILSAYAAAEKTLTQPA